LVSGVDAGLLLRLTVQVDSLLCKYCDIGPASKAPIKISPSIFLYRSFIHSSAAPLSAAPHSVDRGTLQLSPGGICTLALGTAIVLALMLVIKHEGDAVAAKE
jgi:hypothetical protein